MYELRCHCGQEGTYCLENEVGHRRILNFATEDNSSHPATHHPVSVALGNSTSISAMVQVDDNLEFSEEAFRFLIDQIKVDLPGTSLPR